MPNPASKNRRKSRAREEKQKLMDVIDNQAKRIKELELENKELRRVWVNE